MNQRDLTLLTDFYELTMMQAIMKRARMKSLFLMYFIVRIPAMEVTQSAPDWNRSLNT